jgi:hypothetical protein
VTAYNLKRKEHWRDLGVDGRILLMNLKRKRVSGYKLDPTG